MAKQTICLNMIVRNETPVIRRCLDSVHPLIDSWVIVDTGSTDGTQALIREVLKDLPGELHERPWVDFAHNRTQALELARGRADYLLLIDADEVIEIDPGFAMPELTGDVYSVLVRYGGCSYTRRMFLRDGIAWRYEGVVHEYVTAPEEVTESGLPGLILVPRHDGARARDPLTYRRDALVLEQALLNEPDNTRYVFYLAQSYRDAGDLEMALRWYRRRVAMQGGWNEEVWFSLYQVAQIQERMQAPWPETMESYLAAYQALADRAEPLYRIAMHYMARQEYHAAHLFLSRAAAIPEPSPARLFVERALYEFQLGAEYAVAAHYAGDYTGAVATANALLRGGRVPAHALDRIITNRRYSVDALVPQSGAPPRHPGLLRVVVPFRDPGPELDDCVESLLRQELSEWEACFIDDGSARDHAARLPTDDPRVTLVRHETAAGAEARLSEHLRGAGPDLIVLPLAAGERLADPAALGRLRDAFADPGCALAYGQFRSPAGRLGNAEPAAGQADFRTRGAALAAGSAVALRAGAWCGSLEESWQGAGFAATRFLDAVVTVHGDAPRPRVHVAEPVPPDAPRPKVSCVMVTLDRLSLAKRAIRSYADQTYPDRELVVVTDGAPRFRDALERHVEAAGIEGVRFVYAEPGEPLGALRNLSLTEARGDVVCQWDDDDCSHPHRLRVQLDDMLARGARASFMTDHLHLVADQRTLCWVDWTLGGAQGTAQLFPGTLMMFADTRFRYPESGPYARRGEDSVLLEQIHAAVPVAHLSGAGYLYLYEYHGRNTFPREHHLNLANFRAPAAQLQAHADVLRDALSYYALPRPVSVVGREGAVFAVN
ncbi:MAG TPA: glycosyltransferase [Longimicrobium sp.]|jgi:glycosyltransferase involved in cell wall biosynthesis|nr:glycosyltransferase [Longimicrobium sp.]